MYNPYITCYTLWQNPCIYEVLSHFSRKLGYGVRGNFKMLEVVYEGTRAKWKKWLSRRNSKDRMGWEKFAAQVEAIFDLPKPRIVHAF